MSADTTESEDQPWERAGVVRRDCEPHRGMPIRVTGTISPLCGCVTLFAGFIPPLHIDEPLGWLPLVSFTVPAVALGLLSAVLGSQDLSKMRTRTMDPEGKGLTADGRMLGRVGVVLCAVAWLCCGAGFIVHLYR
jgi:hypothetical protein